MLVQCGSSVELWENDVNHHEMIIFLCSCYLRCLLSNQNGSFVYVGTSQKPTCPHKKKCTKCWWGNNTDPDSHSNRMGGNRGDIEKQTWQILAQKHICDKVKRIISENYRKAATRSDFCSVDFKQKTCLFVRDIWCKTFLFDRKRSVKSQESALHNPIEVKAIAKKAAGSLRTKRFEWQVGPRLFSGQLQAFCATCLSSNISYLNKIGLRGSKQVYPMVLSGFRHFDVPEFSFQTGWNGRRALTSTVSCVLVWSSHCGMKNSTETSITALLALKQNIQSLIKRVQYVSQKEYCTLKGSWMPMPLPIMQTSLAKILCILNFIEIVNLQMRILSLCIMLLQACIICFYETLCFLIF